MSGTGFRVASRRIQTEKSTKHIGVARIASGLTRDALLSPGPDYSRLDLLPGVRLKRLQGQHRVQAAKETSGSADTYWVRILNILEISGMPYLAENEGDMHRLDAASVRALELKAPGAYDGKPEVFMVASVRERFSARLVANSGKPFGLGFALPVDCLVPSLSGFFDDLKHLKLVADGVKWLERLERRETIRSALEYSFSDADHGNNLCLVQTSSSSFRSVSGSDIDWFDVACRVLWLYALREYLERPTEPNKKLAGTRNGQDNEKRDPDREIARRLLLTARKSDRFGYHNLERCVTGVTEWIKSAQAIRDGDDTDEGEDQVRLPNRSGIPNLPDQARDKSYLFLDKLHADVVCGPTLTSLFIQRSMYFAFFGKQISVDAVDVNSIYKEQATTDQPRPGPEQSAGGHPRAELMIVDETHQQDRLENLRQTADKQEARLEQLTQWERDQQENIAQLQNAVSEPEERLIASSRDVEVLQEKLDSIRRAEAEQVIRLESLEADEEKRRTIIGTLEQTQHKLGEEIQLDLLAAGQREQALRDDEAQTARLKQLSEEEQENQRNLD
ncbi:hypothetical protein BDV32DRAFT_148250 [Aspergillus pseudonomiae]|nr:hypothetical protein BDV32DRAFT_148250 [Aspergillus pseudonomiae]